MTAGERLERAPERFETERLVMRRPAVGDSRAILERYAGDPAVVRYVGWPRVRSVADARSFVTLSDGAWGEWPAGPYLLLSRADGTLLGGTGLDFETRERASTGYVLARDAWGRGIATEALLAMVALADRLGVLRLHAYCHTAHAASWRVLEKGGFQREGVLRRYHAFPNLEGGPICDVFCYARIFPGNAGDA